MRLVARALPIAMLLFALVPFVRPRSARTVPLYAARQGLMCQSCHFDPNGGGPRNDFGFSYARNRHSLEADTSEAWKDLAVMNRLGENVPVYLGVNQRFMLLANAIAKSDSLERLAFFNMENALHFAFQPHQRLALVYTADAFSEGGTSGRFASKDAFGLVSGFPLDGYLKAGRFRTPFGLRMDDHTVATRNSFLDFQTGQTFLPYDPRSPDMGVEYGTSQGSLFGRLALTNGGASVFGGQFAETKTLKVGYNNAWYQGAVSLYDNYQKESFSSRRRATRWGYYGIGHYRKLALLGEIAAGTDEAITGEKTNLLAGFAEADYALSRAWNLRLRFDRLEADRSSDRIVREQNTYQRYALEGEYVPVPFAELRWVARVVDPRADKDPFGNELKSEKQAYLQMHFSY